MTNNRWAVALIFLSISLGLIWVGRQLRKIADKTQSFETFLPNNMPEKFSVPPNVAKTPIEIRGRKVIGTFPSPAKDGQTEIVLQNKVADWRRGLERAFYAQAGAALKDVHIEKLGSFIWSDGGQALNVESVRVVLQNVRGERTNFNAMVDSQSGKIIQTWNQPVIDPLNPRDKQGVRIDPRYFHD